ncbi:MULTISPECIES: hypothetical protein [unclassified Caballeronia]|uniref:hypothetical protein n=1 Tax=unclassified Caballeronia TaxID=2646786 RepID=UPI002859D7DD|nr:MULTISPECIES: hypothetical protein [unclassified Caballeronia]MDR5776263.1 hypothetical protein [Caballeronia sp. LZ002]MDR5801179.1 hypothetical protein [Caballeronia sp. LZ001]MDR5851703.1 hypothetical protein [Caballeronia sp. LZ003]
MSDAIDEVQIRRLFMLLHGMYGNAVLDKYRIGQVENGEDVGMSSARQVWLNGLREFPQPIVLKALAKCSEKHKTFPPTLPEFRDICKSLMPRQWISKSDVPRLEMSEALRTEQIERARRAIAQTRLEREGGLTTEDGIRGLHVLIAKAVGHAGGDEAATLLQLDAKRMGAA